MDDVTLDDSILPTTRELQLIATRDAVRELVAFYLQRRRFLLLAFSQEAVRGEGLGGGERGAGRKR